MNAGKAFFDTNVLLYMYVAGGAKSDRAKDLFRHHNTTKTILLSTQVIQEFYVAGMRKLRMPHAELREATISFLEQPLVRNGPEEISAALEIETRYQISFWDALIVAAAESGGADVLYTEDLNHGQKYGSVTVHNPFRA
jgi:predicted nucleic acid-binding protein